jgi:hypothetical protein
VLHRRRHCCGRHCCGHLRDACWLCASFALAGAGACLLGVCGGWVLAGFWPSAHGKAAVGRQETARPAGGLPLVADAAGVKSAGRGSFGYGELSKIYSLATAEDYAGQQTAYSKQGRCPHKERRWRMLPSGRRWRRITGGMYTVRALGERWWGLPEGPGAGIANQCQDLRWDRWG